MPAQQSDLLLTISKKVQTLLAKKNSDKAITVNKDIQKALIKIKNNN